MEKRQKFKFQLYCSGISGNVDSVGLGLAWQQTYWSLPDTCFDNFHVSRQRTQWSPNFALHIWISISNTGFPDTCFDNFQVLCPCLCLLSRRFPHFIPDTCFLTFQVSTIPDVLVSALWKCTFPHFNSRQRTQWSPETSLQISEMR